LQNRACRFGLKFPPCKIDPATGIMIPQHRVIKQSSTHGVTDYCYFSAVTVISARGCPSSGRQLDSVYQPSHVTRLLWFTWLEEGGVNSLPVSLILGRTSSMRPNKLWTRPDNGAARAQAPGCQWGSCGSVRRGTGRDKCIQ